MFPGPRQNLGISQDIFEWWGTCTLGFLCHFTASIDRTLFNGEDSNKLIAVILPDVGSFGQKGNGLVETFMCSDMDNYTDKVVELESKSPDWSEKAQAYVLNFHGRVTRVG